MNEQEQEREREAARIFFQGMNAAMNGQTARSSGPHSARAFEMAGEYDLEVLEVDVRLVGQTIFFKPAAAPAE